MAHHQLRQPPPLGRTANAVVGQAVRRRGHQLQQPPFARQRSHACTGAHARARVGLRRAPPRRRAGRRGPLAVLPRHGRASPDHHRPSGCAVEAIRAFWTRSRRLAREFRTQIWRSVAATSHAFFRRSDRWIGDFFTPSQSRFAGPTSSACISPPQLHLACYQFRGEAGLCGFSGTSPLLISCSGYRGE
ncbi:leucine-rich repeat extensin-like protein 7 [Iris pallida]|uniref:Leucine-rich repeat extensin-like protein 7 n=1 Tax=Iris pallida TaxID=29817 RepID=A0AAX6H7S7_IRIPA|nr:leucine-rich repeat extensin-like protein 7 [Iris pallida]